MNISFYIFFHLIRLYDCISIIIWCYKYKKLCRSFLVHPVNSNKNNLQIRANFSHTPAFISRIISIKSPTFIISILRGAHLMIPPNREREAGPRGTNNSLIWWKQNGVCEKLKIKERRSIFINRDGGSTEICWVKWAVINYFFNAKGTFDGRRMGLLIINIYLHGPK